MRRMGAENERGLEEDLVDSARARLVRREPLVLAPVRQLVPEPEAQELGRIEADVRLDGLLASPEELLHVIVPGSEGPAAKWLQLRIQVVAEARERPVVADRDRNAGERDIRPRSVRDTVAIGVDQVAWNGAAGDDVVTRDETATDRPHSFTADRQQRMQPAFRAVFVADIEAGKRVTQPIGVETVGDGRAELDRVLVAELEERPQTSG